MVRITEALGKSKTNKKEGEGVRLGVEGSEAKKPKRKGNNEHSAAVRPDSHDGAE